ncbi:AraC family transcriptional regulator [Calorimonas adulescens]|uniref:AraC family transcriptional regulator n=2 Tax=Calorimonas adulescens TaxID=2606906 RepID=A0A5D8QCJ7_9THEO|nr:AraC family transcriptional regulator [Calorimonas adulescens]
MKMKVNEIIDRLNLKLLSGTNGLSKEVNDVYICDLLSYVMSHASENSLWITVQTHINIVAVAELVGISCIVIPENINVDSDTLERAERESIPIVSTSLTSYHIACRLKELGI